ncbi:MAG: hypothetical protein CTY35_12440 [Methylotenera sp.]|nr:MAG: hypothetical protein CTY35_12440 [Methylotenera sp.]
MKTILVMLLLTPLLAHTKPNSEWVYMISDPNFDYWIKPMTYKTRNGFVSALIQAYNDETNKSYIGRYSISEIACFTGRGNVSIYSTNNRILSMHTYTEGSKKIQSAVAEKICSQFLQSQPQE